MDSWTQTFASIDWPQEDTKTVPISVIHVDPPMLIVTTRNKRNCCSCVRIRCCEFDEYYLKVVICKLPPTQAGSFIFPGVSVRRSRSILTLQHTGKPLYGETRKRISQIRFYSLLFVLTDFDVVNHVGLCRGLLILLQVEEGEERALD